MLSKKEEIKAIVCGVLCKIGAHGFVYAFVNGEWIRSTKTRDEVEVAASGFTKTSESGRKQCIEEGCMETHKSKYGLCREHYRRAWNKKTLRYVY